MDAFSAHVQHCVWMSSCAPRWSKRVHDSVSAGFLTQELSWKSLHHRTPTGPCLYCTRSLKHDGLCFYTNCLGEDTTGQGRPTAPTHATISHHNYRITCGQKKTSTALIYCLKEVGHALEYEASCWSEKNKTFYSPLIRNKIKPGLKLWAILGTTASVTASRNWTKAKS